jgi:uncharacterized membrane protein YjjB (DUF3815 family)
MDSHVERRTYLQMFRSCSGTVADRRNQYRYLAWAALWAASFATATWALSRGLVQGGTAAWATAILPLIPGLLALRAYLRFLTEADELIRKIQFESLAFGFGCGVLAGLGYPLLERAGAPEAPELMLLVMMFGWAIRQLWAMHQYR